MYNAANQLLCTGNYSGTITFSNNTLTSPPALGHTFITAYSTSGDVEWFVSLGGIVKSVVAYGSTINNISNTFSITGTFWDSLAFGPHSINSGGLNQRDMFIAVAKFDTLTTSIPMQLAGFDFNVYPNPVSNVLSVELQNTLQPMDVTLLDVNGTVVYSSLMQHGKILIPVTELPGGQYLLHVKQGDTMLAKPVIVRH